MLDGAGDRLAGASAVVTGAGQGIGAAIAKGLARERRARCGQRSTCRHSGGGLSARSRAEGGSADYCVGDVTDPVHVAQSDGSWLRDRAGFSTCW